MFSVLIEGHGTVVMFPFVSVGSGSNEWWEWKIFNVSYASDSLGGCILSFIHGKMSW